jgi:hypothetical protein
MAVRGHGRRAPQSGVGRRSAAGVLIAHGQGSTAEHELHLLRGAIDVIASGGARRVTLVAMHAAEAILPEAQGLADEHGVVIRAIRSGKDDLCDIAVEPVG